MISGNLEYPFCSRNNINIDWESKKELNVVNNDERSSSLWISILSLWLTDVHTIYIYSECSNFVYPSITIGLFWKSHNDSYGICIITESFLCR